MGSENATGGVKGPLSAACAANRHAGAQTLRLCPARSTLLPREGAGRVYSRKRRLVLWRRHWWGEE